jgi:hypothetical protein
MVLVSVASVSVFSLVANRTPKLIKKKSKVQSKTGHGGPEGWKSNGCTLALTSGIGPNAMPRLFYPRETNSVFMAPGARRTPDGCGNSVLLGFNPRSLQPVTSLYTNDAFPTNIYYGK